MQKKTEILIIGGNSFVARSFVKYNTLNCTINIVCRENLNLNNAIIVSDYNKITDDVFVGKDVVINCTAIVHQQKKIATDLFFNVNHKLAVQLAEQAKKNNVKQFIQFSSIAVYGNTEKVNESTKENPINDYGKSKLLADDDLKKIISKNFNITIFRAPMIYGGENPPGNMLRLIKLVEKGIPLPLANANGERDFINIKNLVKHIEIAIANNKSEMLLVTDNEPISTKDLVIKIKNILHKNTSFFPLPSFALTVLKKLKPTVFEKLFSTLKITPNQILESEQNNNIDEGLKDMIQYYLKNKVS